MTDVPQKCAKISFSSAAVSLSSSHPAPAGIEAASTKWCAGLLACPLAGTQVLLLSVEAHTKLSPASVQTLAVQFNGGLGYENSLP